MKSQGLLAKGYSVKIQKKKGWCTTSVPLAICDNVKPFLLL